MSQDWPAGRGEGDEEEDYIPPPPRAPRPAARPAPRPAAPAPVASRRPATRPAPQRDNFPLAVSAVVVVLIVGLMAVFLLSNRGDTGTTAPGGANPGGIPGAATLPTSTTAPVGQVAGDATVAPATDQPPRMALDEFKALYDDPAKRPLIIDVRAKDAFDAGHIAGAINFPESDVDTRVAELPKDKLIVAYCQ
jgi:hypothetical protein